MQDLVGRDADVDWLYNAALSPGSFPLAVSIRDRAGVRSDPDGLAACALLAHMVLYPDTEACPIPAKPVRAAVKRITDTLGFKLYADTVEWVLQEDNPDPERLRRVIKESAGCTRTAVELWREPAKLIVMTKRKRTKEEVGEGRKKRRRTLFSEKSVAKNTDCM